MIDAIRAILGLGPLYADDPSAIHMLTCVRMLNSDSLGVGWTDGNYRKSERVDGHGSTVLR